MKPYYDEDGITIYNAANESVLAGLETSKGFSSMSERL
jgi:hypothetical protein